MSAFKPKLIRENFANQEAYINAFYVSKGINKTYQDYLYWKNIRIAGKPVSMPKRAKETGVGKTTLYIWDKDFEKEQGSHEQAS